MKWAVKMSKKSLDLSTAVKYHKDKFPPKSLDYKTLLKPLSEAQDYLARLDTKMNNVQGSEWLIAPLLRQDAITSSRMEGTISTIEELYKFQAQENGDDGASLSLKKPDDIREIFHYAKALNKAEDAIEKGHPLNQSLIRQTHKIFISAGRGAHKNPGAYKTEQNYVGDNYGKVFFEPISPIELGAGMDKLFDFIHTKDTKDGMPSLIRAAIAHVEFEALHPFEDGNGRIGRMLITLMFWRLGILQKPYFFVSGYFEQHKNEYIERMREVSASDDWTGWVVFFLQAMKEQAGVNIEILDDISKLYQDTEEQLRMLLNSKFYNDVLNYIFSNPIFFNGNFVNEGRIPKPSARKIITKLEKEKILEKIERASGRRSALYKFGKFIDLIDV